MIVVDTNILSTFACVNRLELLFQVAERDTLYLPPAVFNELNEGLSRGKTYLQPLLDKIQTDTTFKLVALTANEGRFMSTLPDQLHTGEREAIALCALRDESVLLTNDKRAYRYCKANLIVSLDLKNILRRLWQAGHCTRTEVQPLIEAIEQSEPEMVIKDQDDIWR